jgi:ABC-type glycerol-3-phosphate transport system substrate-binding protein
LYEFIDADPRLGRGDFVVGVLRSFETDGKLYHMSPNFSISTLIGHPDVVGSSPWWTFDEFRTVLEENPQATKPLGEWFDGRSLFYSIIRRNMTSFVDWENGNAYFDNDYFISLLEFAYAFDVGLDINRNENTDGIDRRPYRFILSGEQIMQQPFLNDFHNYLLSQHIFGGEIVFKGFPVKQGSGSNLSGGLSMAISSTSRNQQGAWEFIRMLLSEEWQSLPVRDYNFGFPTNRNVFEQKLAEAMEMNSPEMVEGRVLDLGPLTQEDADNIRALLDSISSVNTNFSDPLNLIISESVEDFFNGLITAQDAARIIQSRASIFVAEQSR